MYDYLSLFMFIVEYEARYGREAGLGITNYQRYLRVIGEDYDEIMKNVLKQKFIQATRHRNKEEVVRLVDKEHADVNSRDSVSFLFYLKKEKKKYLHHIFYYIQYVVFE